jgi:hypothetical protein
MPRVVAEVGDHAAGLFEDGNFRWRTLPDGAAATGRLRLPSFFCGVIARDARIQAPERSQLIGNSRCASCRLGTLTYVESGRGALTGLP